jgi:hypothetical protein
LARTRDQRIESGRRRPKWERALEREALRALLHLQDVFDVVATVGRGAKLYVSGGTVRN